VTDTSTARAGSNPCPDDVLLGRYRLVDRVGDTAGTTVWRSYDERLRRPVGLRLVARDSEVAAKLRTAAVDASRVTDRRAVPVLDICDDEEHDRLVVVTEWISGTAFGDYLGARRGEPLPPRDAATLALEVARCLAAAEEAGVTHAHLRPNAVMITDSGEVRVRGLGVDQALHGVEPDDLDPKLADVHAVGAVLFAGLTGRWPGTIDVEHLPGVPAIDGDRTPPPSRVVADVPSDLDTICTRALQTTHAPKGLGHFTDVTQVVDALSASLVTPPHEAAPSRGWGRLALRTTAVILVALAAVGLVGLGVRLILGFGGTPLTVARNTVTPLSPSPSVSATAPAPSAGEQVLPIVSVVDYDPFGNDKHENPQEAPLAVDANPATAWHTVRYKSPDLGGGKPGVGLLVDLGAPRPVDAVVLRLVGNGTDLSLLATDNPAAPESTYTRMAEVTGAGNSVTLRVPKPVTTRYLLIWLTTVPSTDGAYQGGISDIRVLG
jgi:serine/threonine protein kinase